MYNSIKALIGSLPFNFFLNYLNYEKSLTKVKVTTSSFLRYIAYEILYSINITLSHQNDF